MGRLVAWFEADLAAINVQFVGVPVEPAPRRRGRPVKKKAPRRR
jgi:hypothetical protein